MENTTAQENGQGDSALRYAVKALKNALPVLEKAAQRSREAGAVYIETRHALSVLIGKPSEIIFWQPREAGK